MLFTSVTKKEDPVASRAGFKYLGLPYCIGSKISKCTEFSTFGDEYI